MAKSKKKKAINKETAIRTWNTKLLITLIVSSLIAVGALVATNLYFMNRSLPKVRVVGIDVGGRTKTEILNILNTNFQGFSNIQDKIQIKVRDAETDLNLNDINFSYNIEETANNAVLSGKNTTNLPALKYIPMNFFKWVDIPLVLSFDQTKLDEYLRVLASEHAKPPVTYSITLEGGEIVVDKGQPGEVADTELLKNEILDSLSNYRLSTLDLKFESVDETLSDEDVITLTNRAQSLIGKSLNLEHEYHTFTLSDNDLISFLAKGGDYQKDKVVQYLTDKVIPVVEREPQNATFVFNDQRVEEFTPAKPGVALNIDDSINAIRSEIIQLENTDAKSTKTTIPVATKSPDITLEDVNNLGIKELVGRGVSYYKGSIPSRIFNIGHAAAKFKSILVTPGEEFSFNKILGDVTALTGYKQAYIIRDGRTVLGDGGGVCQVSTTLFRAVLNAGLPVIDRRAHSYRVGYYEQGSPAGLDATVFYPTTDFKFKNDTPGHLLIQSIYDPKNYTLIFEIYGTKDGRIATVSKPVTSGVTAPPEDLYVDDHTLPTGQIKQIDHKAWGAKISFNYKVERAGEVLIDKTFVSNYRPWQSVFLRGTGPAI